MNDQEQGTEVEVKPLTDWANAPTLQNLKQDLQDAKPIHDTQAGKIAGWLDNLNITGSAKVKPANGGSAIQPKLIRKQAEWRYAALSEPFLAAEDLFNVKPKTAEDRKAAQQNALVLNNQFNSNSGGIDKQRFIDEYVRTAVDEGTVITRVGWEFHEEPYECPVYEFVLDPSMAQLHEELAQMRADSPSKYISDVPKELKEAHELSLEHGAPYRPVDTGETETCYRTVYNRPTVEVCDYRNVVFDPTCKGVIEKAGFAIESFESSKAILAKDRRYTNLDRIQVGNNSVLSAPDHAPDGGHHNFNFSDEPRKKFVVYQYWGWWDIEGDGKLVPIVVAWVGNTIIRMEVNPYPDKQLPFVVEQYLPVRGETYGEPDGALLEDNQKVLGAVTRGMIDLMGKSANGQTGIRRDMLDVTNRRKFDRGQDYEFNPNVDPRQGVFMHTYPEIPNSAMNVLQLQQFEAESLTGVRSFSGGISGESLGDVAAGVRSALDAASKRELGILRRLKSGIIKIGRKIISMNAEFLSDEEVIRISDEEFVTVRRDDLAGQFDLELSISTPEEDNYKAEQLAFMYQTTAPNGDPELNKMILADIARLRKMPDLARKIERHQPQPDPLQQAMAQAQLALIQAQVAEIQAKVQQLTSQAQLNMAKANTEVATAGNIQSDTDQKNLDFVEQESGVKQEREKELHGAQAVAQTQQMLVKHRLDQQENDKDRRLDLLKEYVKAKAKPKSA